MCRSLWGAGGGGWVVADVALTRPERVLIVLSAVDQVVRILEPKGTFDII